MEFVKRPVAIFTLSFFISFCILASLNITHSFFPALTTGIALCLSAIFSLIFSKSKKKHSKELSVLGRYGTVLFSGMLFAAIFFSLVFPAKETELCSSKAFISEFTVIDVCYESDANGTYIVEIKNIDNESVKFKAVLDSPEKLTIGDLGYAKLKFSLPSDSGTFNEKSYFLSKGASVKGEASDIIVTSRDMSNIKVRLYLLRSKLSGILTRHMAEETGGVLKALLLGDKSSLSGKTKRDFSRLGISHLAAISGMHVSFISAALGIFLKRFGKRRAAVINVAAVIFYTAITGFSASAVRAAFICTLTCIIMEIGISYDGITALGISGFIMLIVNPYFAFDVGAKLSFSAYAGCIFAMSFQKKLPRKDKSAKNEKFYHIKALFRKILQTLLMTVIVVMFTLPVTFLYYDSTSIIAPLSNLIFVPLFSLLVYLSISVLILSPITPVYILFSKVTDFICSVILDSIKFLSGAENVTVSLNYKFSLYIIIPAVISCAALCIVRKKKLKIIFSLFLAAAVISYGAGVFIHNESLQGKTLISRVGSTSGDDIVIVSDDLCAAIDISNGSASNASLISKELSELCETELDVLILTGCDEGHLRFASKLTNLIFIRQAFLPSPDDCDKNLYEDVKNILISAGTNVQIIPDEMKLGETNIDFYEKGHITGESEPVISFEVSRKTERFLYLGSGWNSTELTLLFEQKSFEHTTVIFGSKGPETKIAFPELSKSGFDKAFIFKDSYKNISHLIYTIPKESRLNSSDKVSFTLEN